MKMFLKKNKIISIVLMSLILLGTFITNIYATDEIIAGADAFLDKGKSETLDSNQIKKTSDLIYNIFLAIGTVVVVIVGAVLGLQFIMGSVEEKAKVQESLIPFVIGSIVIFGSFGIWKAIVLALQVLD